MSGAIDDGHAARPAYAQVAIAAAEAHAPTPRLRLAAYDRAASECGEPSLGELKARHRELHLCLRCIHHMVCGMAKALDLNLLVTVATCLAFEPDDSEGTRDVCELLPVEPLPST